MNNIENLTGQKFGRLIVIERMPNSKHNKSRWKVLCDCGSEKVVIAQGLKRGTVKSCGCLRKETTKMNNFKDLTGQKFGRWTVISREPNNKNYSAMWSVLCDCGIKKIVSSARLIGGQSKSCGCFNIDSIKERRTGNFSSKKGDGGFNLLYARYKGGAKTRNLSFELTKEEFAILTKFPCKYCGKLPATISKLRNSKNKQLSHEMIERSIYIYNGVDRVDNSKGYTSNNVVPCCSLCNWAKNNLSQEEWESWRNNIADTVIKERVVLNKV